MSIFKVERRTENIEQKLGDQLWKIFHESEKESTNVLMKSVVDSIINKLCTDNNIKQSTIKPHILIKDEVNAFALPGGHLVIYTGLIDACDKQEELAGVIGHEIAHIQLNHVMKKLIREIGLSTLISMTSGGGGGIGREVAKMLSSSAFDRALEKEADFKSVDYMANAHINPEGLAEFLFKMAEKDPGVTKYFSWISTHPDLKDRAAYIIEYAKTKTGRTEQIISSSTWEKIKQQKEAE